MNTINILKYLERSVSTGEKGKMWLQSCVNSLYEAGLRHDNKIALIAVKTNNNLSRRIPEKDVEIQGSVWAGLKWTSMMDTLNRIVMSDTSLQYYY